jgi:hypothetical protein
VNGKDPRAHFLTSHVSNRVCQTLDNSFALSFFIHAAQPLAQGLCIRKIPFEYIVYQIVNGDALR